MLGSTEGFLRMLARTLLTVLGMSLCAALPTAAAVEPASPRARPNVLFLFSDDQRADTIHALGDPLGKER